MRWLADIIRAGITGVMWMVIAGISLAILGFSLSATSPLGMLMGLAVLGGMILVAMAITVAIWRVAISWQGTGTQTQGERGDPAFDGTKEKRDTAQLMERLVDKLDNDELVELETLLMSRADMRQLE